MSRVEHFLAFISQAVIPAKAGIQSRNTGFPRIRVRGRLSQARNDKRSKGVYGALH